MQIRNGLLTALLFVALAAGPARALEAPLGRSLATPTGDRLFPLYAGQVLPGWLSSFGAPAMRIAYRGYFERRALGGGRTLAILRHEGLLGAYVFEGDRCIGQVLFEPFRLDEPEGFTARLARSAKARPSFFASADRRTALDATFYERRLGRLIERRAIVMLPIQEDGLTRPVPCLGLEAIYPVDLDGVLGPLLAEGQSGLARFWDVRGPY